MTLLATRSKKSSLSPPSLHLRLVLRRWARFDGLKIQHADQSHLFVGDGYRTHEVPVGSLLVLNRDRKIFDAFENVGAQMTESDIAGFWSRIPIAVSNASSVPMRHAAYSNLLGPPNLNVNFKCSKKKIGFPRF